MTARDKWKQIQALVGTAQDGIPGPKDDAALMVLREAAKQEYLNEAGREIGFMDGSPIIQKGNVISFTAGFQVDADGSPRAYHPAGSPPGLDYLANAGHDGNWWGLATYSSGQPIVQGEADSAPGFYVSTTALQNPKYGIADPRRYTNSETVSFIVLPSNFPAKVPLGAKCAVTFMGNRALAIYADIGPRFQLGEGSIALAKYLGINSDPKRGGTEEKMLYEVYLS